MYVFKSLAPNNLVVDWMWSVREKEMIQAKQKCGIKLNGGILKNK